MLLFRETNKIILIIFILHQFKDVKLLTILLLQRKSVKLDGNKIITKYFNKVTYTVLRTNKIKLKISN